MARVWLPSEDMADVHVIRQNYARARQAYEQAPSNETAAAFQEAKAIRARAIRAIAREDGATPLHLSRMFRCSKTVIREVLAEGEAA